MYTLGGLYIQVPLYINYYNVSLGWSFMQVPLHMYCIYPLLCCSFGLSFAVESKFIFPTTNLYKLTSSCSEVVEGGYKFVQACIIL